MKDDALSGFFGEIRGREAGLGAGRKQIKQDRGDTNRHQSFETRTRESSKNEKEQNRLFANIGRGLGPGAE